MHAPASSHVAGSVLAGFEHARSTVAAHVFPGVKVHAATAADSSVVTASHTVLSVSTVTEEQAVASAPTDVVAVSEHVPGPGVKVHAPAAEHVAESVLAALHTRSKVVVHVPGKVEPAAQHVPSPG